MKMVNGQVEYVQGSAQEPYEIKCVGEIVSCSCPAWKNQSTPINKRTCKHIRKLCGDDVESARIGGSLTMRAPKTKSKVQAIPPALQQAHKWKKSIDPTGYLMSEKLDGVRAYWDGTNLISRLGNKFYPPAWFIADLGTTKLDGELWIGRKKFQETVSIVKTEGLDIEWKQITYKLFDLPDSTDTFEVNYATMLKMKLPAHCKVVSQVVCKGLEHLQTMLGQVESVRGEGLMIRLKDAKYVGHRTSNILKVKSVITDEATIVGFSPGKGKHAGKLGAYECKLANGILFNVGSGISDKERSHPLAIGTKITFEYKELTPDRVPREPIYCGEAIDK